MMFEPSNSSSSSERIASWTALLEAQFLLDTASSSFDTHESNSRKDVNLEKKVNIESYLLNSAAPPTIPPILSTPEWSLAVLEEMENEELNLPDEPGDQAVHSSFGKELNKRIRRNQKRLRRKWELKKHLPLACYYQSPEDWEDLFLMRKMLGGKGQSSDIEGRTSSEADSDECNSHLTYSLDRVMEDKKVEVSRSFINHQLTDQESQWQK